MSLVADGRRASGPLPSSRHNLPGELTSFVGRQRDLATIPHLLSQTRLLTITGAGGVGKTRLALRVATNLLASFPDGVWLVELAVLADPAAIPHAVASALGVQGMVDRPPLATLEAALAARRTLLVLDTCEHLIGAVAQLAETLLRACPRLRILATSRERLRVPGELTWRLSPLDAPEPTVPLSPEALSQFDAPALFLERARARCPGFTLAADDVPIVIDICGRLAGLPLAIELAAAHAGALALPDIATRLDQLWLARAGSRTLPRQETLQATLDWSHALLTDLERLLYRRLAIFAGSFAAEAVEETCAGADIRTAEILGLLAALVEKSLVEAQTQERDTRFRLLEPVRQDAWQRLEASGELARFRWRHASYFVRLAELAEPKLTSGERAPWLARLRGDAANLRAALAWSLSTNSDPEPESGEATPTTEIALRLVGALFWYWNFHGELHEGFTLTEAALAGSTNATAGARAKALYTSGELAWLLGKAELARERLEASARLWRQLANRRGVAYTLQVLASLSDTAESFPLAEESLALFREIGDRWGVALATHSIGLLALLRGDALTARARFEEAMAQYQALGDVWFTAHVLNGLGDLARDAGDDASAQRLYQQSLDLLQHEHAVGSVPSLLHNLGQVALRQGDARRSLRLFHESLVRFRDQGDRRGIAESLAGLAGALSALKSPERAARLFGAADGLLESAGLTPWPANASDRTRSLATVRDQLDEVTFGAAWANGRSLPIEQAIQEALTATGPILPAADDQRLAGLTPRERQVAVLLERGLTNRQIATALVTTEGTASLHAKHVLHKLGFSSRVQLAARAAATRLTRVPDLSLSTGPSYPSGEMPGLILDR